MESKFSKNASHSIIIKITDKKDFDWYMLWDTDMPVTRGYCLKKFKKVYLKIHNKNRHSSFDKKRFQRVEEFGSSLFEYVKNSGLQRVEEFGSSLFEYVKNSGQNYLDRNSLGENGRCLTNDEIIKIYCG